MAIEVLLDASAVLAAVLNEEGGSSVAAALDQAAISAINAVEVMGVLARRLPPAEAEDDFNSLELTVLPFTQREAPLAMSLLARHRKVLSLGDAACLATAKIVGIPVLTGDRIWATLPLGIEVRLIRP